jgi:hypothetical protein
MVIGDGKVGKLEVHPLIMLVIIFLTSIIDSKNTSL